MRISKLLVATSNKGKVKEIIPLLKGFIPEILSLSDFPGIEEVEETGKTFEENAVLKSEGYFAQTGVPTLADDSGLEVDFLDGAPGVHSSRFAGESAEDKDNNRKLTGILGDLPDEKRSARFWCVMALTIDGETKTFSGTVEGRIIAQERGSHGFGYDPLFVPDGYDMTFAELGNEVKSKISHRTKALEQVINYLGDSLNQEIWKQ